MSKSKLNIAIRVDASGQIGIGHFMRCLTLADALKMNGASITFFSREMPLNLQGVLLAKGHSYLPMSTNSLGDSFNDLKHSSWLSVSQAQDSTDAIKLLPKINWDWIIVDHYALDSRWEGVLKKFCKKLMVIDDLADRQHICDLLLDQTFERLSGDYSKLVPDDCTVLCGSQYALLRAEFSVKRALRFSKKVNPSPHHILLNMGGTDYRGATYEVLKSLNDTKCIPTATKLSIVMGSASPLLQSVIELSQTVPWETDIHIDVLDMAQLMMGVDWIIGAAGSTSWERCCLGIPTLLLTLADNQKMIAHKLQEAGAVISLDYDSKNFTNELCQAVVEISQSATLINLSKRASMICDGLGVNRVLEFMSE